MPRTSADTAPAAPRRPRIPAAERERMIVEAAIPFFAEHGLEGQTRLLAQSLGISHSVLYRHFPSKEGLIAAVCEELFRRRWQPEWEEILLDRDVPLEERLLRFYISAGALILSTEWMRMALFVGLADRTAPSGLGRLLQERILRPLATALRDEAQRAGRPISASAAEDEAWSLHGRVFYVGMRGAVWRGATPRSQEIALEAAIRSYVRGAAALIPEPA